MKKYPEKLLCKKRLMLLPKTTQRRVVLLEGFFYDIIEVRKLDYYPKSYVLINVRADVNFEFSTSDDGVVQPYIWDYFYTERELRKLKLKKLKKCSKCSKLETK